MSGQREKEEIPVTFAPAPARDARFDVKERWIECNNLPPGDPGRAIEFLHRQMNEEINGMECAARTLVDFPDTAWDLRMCIARQCYDEARHVEMFRELLERGGGRVGQSPVLNFQYRIIAHVDNLVGRLAVQNRSFEAEGVDAVEPEILSARARGDGHLAELYDAQLADEICHVRYANRYIAEVASRDPASVMRVGRALDYASRAFLQVMGREAIDSVNYPVNRTGRLEAGFSPEEIEHSSKLRSAKTASRSRGPV